MQAKTVGTLGKNVLTRSGWSEAEEELLRERLSNAAREGTPLREVFDSVAVETGRKPNSVRNYYYTALRSRIAGKEEPALVRRERSSFTPFTDEEIRQLLKSILSKQAAGMSVRACAMALGSGNRSRMLRFQNKYRSLLKNRRPLVEDVIRQLEQEGVACVNPYGDGGKSLFPPEMAAREDGRTLAREMLDAFEEEAGLDLIELASNMNALVTRMNREDDGGLRRRALTAEEQADRTMKKFRQLALAVRDYLTTKDPALLANVRSLVQEIDAPEAKILN
jgi:DNA-binding transcriptional MerR regulator